VGVKTVIRCDGQKSKGIVLGDGFDEEACAIGIFGGQDGTINASECRFKDPLSGWQKM
jgi:hypothetical protein